MNSVSGDHASVCDSISSSSRSSTSGWADARTGESSTSHPRTKISFPNHKTLEAKRPPALDISLCRPNTPPTTPPRLSADSCLAPAAPMQQNVHMSNVGSIKTYTHMPLHAGPHQHGTIPLVHAVAVSAHAGMQCYYVPPQQSLYHHHHHHYHHANFSNQIISSAAPQHLPHTYASPGVRAVSLSGTSSMLPQTNLFQPAPVRDVRSSENVPYLTPHVTNQPLNTTFHKDYGVRTTDTPMHPSVPSPNRDGMDYSQGCGLSTPLSSPEMTIHTHTQSSLRSGQNQFVSPAPSTTPPLGHVCNLTAASHTSSPVLGGRPPIRTMLDEKRVHYAGGNRTAAPPSSAMRQPLYQRTGTGWQVPAAHSAHLPHRSNDNFGAMQQPRPNVTNRTSTTGVYMPHGARTLQRPIAPGWDPRSTQQPGFKAPAGGVPQGGTASSSSSVFHGATAEPALHKRTRGDRAQKVNRLTNLLGPVKRDVSKSEGHHLNMSSVTPHSVDRMKTHSPTHSPMHSSITNPRSASVRVCANYYTTMSPLIPKTTLPPSTAQQAANSVSGTEPRQQFFSSAQRQVVAAPDRVSETLREPIRDHTGIRTHTSMSNITSIHASSPPSRSPVLELKPHEPLAPMPAGPVPHEHFHDTLVGRNAVHCGTRAHAFPSMTQNVNQDARIEVIQTLSGNTTHESSSPTHELQNQTSANVSGSDPVSNPSFLSESLNEMKLSPKIVVITTSVLAPNIHGPGPSQQDLSMEPLSQAATLTDRFASTAPEDTGASAIPAGL